MDDWKQTVAANLTALRKSHHYTQVQLAEQLHYSDKAVSKWERGESLPDLAVMKQLADFYGITIDALMRPPTADEPAPAPAAVPAEAPAADPAPVPAEAPAPAVPDLPNRGSRHNKAMIVGMAVLLVWLIATLIFVVLDTVVPGMKYGWFLFVYSLPISAVVCLVFNSIWFNPRHNYAIISVLVWSVLGSMFLTFLEYRIYKLFLIGVPAQLIILLWSRMRSTKQ